MPTTKIVIRWGAAIGLGVLFSFLFSVSEKFWIPLAACYVMQTSTGVSLRQGVERYLLMGISVCLVSFFNLKIMITLLMMTAVFVWGTEGFLLSLVILPALFIAISPGGISERLFAITIGSLLGILLKLIIYPDKIEIEFRQALIPILQAYSEYFSAIMNLFLDNPLGKTVAENKKKLVEEMLVAAPDWAYEAGLSLPFRAGHRHFLIRTEQLAEVLFNMHYLAGKKTDPQLLKILQPQLAICAAAVEKIISALISVLALKKSEGIEDFNHALDAIEKKFLDFSSRNIYFYEFIYDLKDLRKLLLKLAEALR